MYWVSDSVTLLAASTVDAVVLIALGAGVVSLICGIIAWVSPLPQAADRTSRTPGHRLADGGFVMAFFFVTLAGAVAVLDDAVGETTSSSTKGKATAAAKSVAGAWDVGKADLAVFDGKATVHSGRLGSELCLMSFYSTQATNRSSKWWTSCEVGSGFSSIAEMRERLAIPRSRDGSLPLDGRVTLEIPASAQVHFLRGRTAPQCPAKEGRCYHGGAVQYRVIEVDERWIAKDDCLEDGNEQTTLAYSPCPEGDDGDG